MSTEKRLDTFKFPSPDQWYCHVSHYEVGHSELHIKAQEMVSGEILTIVFIATIYFEGPLMWRGADFLLEPQEECEALMQKVGETGLKVLLEARRLFSCRISNASDLSTKVRIVAGESARVTDKDVAILW
jgi:hypothetical protein